MANEKKTAAEKATAAATATATKAATETVKPKPEKSATVKKMTELQALKNAGKISTLHSMIMLVAVKEFCEKAAQTESSGLVNEAQIAQDILNAIKAAGH